MLRLGVGRANGRVAVKRGPQHTQEKHAALVSKEMPPSEENRVRV
jgi:hypothetical protein